MNDQEIQALIIRRAGILAEVAKNESYKTALSKQIQDKIDALVPQELKDELKNIETEYSTLDLVAQAEVLKKEIEAEVLQAGHSVKVDQVGQAVYNSGRVTWDSEKLDGLMVAVPQLKEFRKVGDPYITFR